MRIGHARSSLLVLSLGVATAGCFHASAKTVSDTPPLEMPSPPPKVVETVEAAPPPQPFPLVEEPARQPVEPPPRVAPPRAEAPSPKPEPPKVEPPPPAVEAPKVAEEAPKPATTLQMTRAGAERDVERAIRGAITHANTDLKRVNTRALNTDARTQYDTAKRFIEQAEDALKKRNLTFALNLADKAQGLAAQLAGR